MGPQISFLLIKMGNLCFVPLRPTGPIFQIHLPSNTPPVVKIVFATTDHDMPPLPHQPPSESSTFQENEITADPDIVQVHMG